jgi:hypothetical protein
LLLRDLKNKKYKLPLREVLKGAEAHLEKLSEITKSVLIDEPTIHTPNLFSYFSLINKIEHFYYRIGKKCDLVFDSSREFNIAFLKALETMKKATRAALIVPGKIPFITGYKSIQSFKTEDSKGNVLIQCADLIGSCIKRSVQKVLWSGEAAPVSETELFFLVLVFSHWTEFDDIFCDFMCSAELAFKIYKVLDKNKP